MQNQKLDEKAIFNAALALESSAARQEYLRSACGADRELFLRVSELLELQAKSPSFLEAPAAGMLATLAMSPPTERIGKNIGRYTLRELLGEGGMGSVYVAEQTEPVRRKVALKIVKPGMDSREVIARFEAERQALALMEHPNIARVLDAGTCEFGRPYFVMELVKGVPITEHCDLNKLKIRDRLELFLQICKAVQHAHQKGIIHRDLKPSNILVTMHDTTPVVKVIDFGVAKAIGHQLSNSTLYTGISQMIGTPLYMSPEQAGQSGLDVDTRSDVYSLGVLLYELLTGSTPITKDTLRQVGYDEMRRIIREVEPPRPSTQVSTLKAADQSTIAQQRCVEPSKFSLLLRGELDWIVMKALEKDRNRRYDTANGLAADVQRFLADEPVEACPPSLSYRFRKIAVKHRVLLTTVVMVVSTMLVGTGVSIWQAVRATQAEIRTDKQRVLAEASADESRRQTTQALFAKAESVKAKQEAEAQRSEVERQRAAISRNLYFADIRLGLIDWNAGNIGRLSSKLISHEPIPGDEDQRGWEWYYLLASIHEEERTLMQHAMQVDSVRWSPNRCYLASTCSGGLVKIYDTTTWQVIRTWKTEHIWGGTWSPDSKRFAWSTTGPDDKCYVGDVGIGEKKSLKGHTGRHVPEWSHDGKYLASGGQGDIQIWDPSSDSSISVLKGSQAGGIRALAWDSEGRLLYLTADTGLRIWAPHAGEDTQLVPSIKEWTANAWSPDGLHLVAGRKDGTCCIYETGDWSMKRQWKAHTGSVRAVAWHPEGTQIASSGADNLIKLWEPDTGRNLSTLRGHLDQVISLDWESSGLQLASGGMDGLVKVWSLPHSPQPRVLVGHAGGARDVVWSEDGKSLRSLGSVDSTCALWDASDGQLISKFEFASQTFGQFSTGGKLLAVASPDPQQLQFLIHDAATGHLLKTVKHETASVSRCAFSPDDSKLAILSSEKLEILDLQSRDSIFTWLGTTNSALSWSSDGRLLARVGRGDPSARYGSLKYGAWTHIFDVEKRQQISKTQIGSNWIPATAISWHPNGQQLVSGDDNGLAEIWDDSTGRKLMSAQFHIGKISDLAWSPDTRRIASGGMDGTVRIWDATNGEELLKLDTHLGVTHVAWSPNGQQLMGTTADGAIHLWDATAGYQYYQGETYACDLLRQRLDVLANQWDFGKTDEFLLKFDQIVREMQPKVSTIPHWVLASTRKLARNMIEKMHFRDAGKFLELLSTLGDNTTSLRKNFAYTLGELAYALWEQGKLEEAATEYREAIRLDPEYPEAHSNLGLVLKDQGKWEEAVTECREAIRLKPKFPEAHNNLGNMLKVQGKLEEAVTEYREAIRLKPKFPEAHDNLGSALRVQGKLEEAVTECREAIRLKPKFPEAHNNLGSALRVQGKLEEAVNEYREAIRLAPEYPEAHSKLGIVLEVQGKLEEAVTEYREAIRLSPNDPLPINNLAWLLATTHDRNWRNPVEALELALKAVQLAPKNENYLNTLGAAQYRVGNWVAAVEALEMANGISDKIFGFNGFFQAMSHWQLEHKQEARVWYEEAVAWMDKNKPDNEELRRFRAEAAKLLGVQDESSSELIIKSVPRPND